MNAGMPYAICRILVHGYLYSMGDARDIIATSAFLSPEFYWLGQLRED